uniref:Sulfur-oxidizing protein SoxZ n=1 Tax=Candidatus Kentrum sp. TUN TaxID=2126343 RepID=A0A450ZLF0_9GAMM|nr:MAG: sulfur-oxidizing protein SoxZ [Candidatus Kentron sp. TUN]VFK58085.1 MAG: sulfur-oxidizing protein SoxZ [Candidatus Kentron sp. TUN]VFK59807.1 MAG: sulfur-oxidizing protein SoxZ [Candidatus Kentron sp. TUN]
MKKRAKIRVPKEVESGQPFMVKTKLRHPMERGGKDKKTGEEIPRKIIHRVEATFDGKRIFAADLQTAISKDPYLAFYCRADASGKLVITWFEDGGEKITLTQAIKVS